LDTSNPDAIALGGPQPGGVAKRSEGFQWHVLHYASPLEPLIFRLLRWLGIEYYQFSYTKRRKGGAIERCLTFPSYLFLRFDAADFKWRGIYQIPGVVSILSTSPERPIGFTEAVMAAMIDFHRSKRISDEAAFELLQPGMILQILAGPLAGREAICEWLDKNAVGVSITIFGRPTTARLQKEAVQIRKTPAEATA
jgi:transcription antitermination factor NusG